jgi:hypothetical protein
VAGHTKKCRQAHAPMTAARVVTGAYIGTRQGARRVAAGLGEPDDGVRHIRLFE